MSEENIKKKLHNLEEAESQRNKMADKVDHAAKHAMHREMKRMLGDHKKCMKEQMAEQSRQHTVELNELKQSKKMATHNLFANKGRARN
jgi:hypothetical protein